MNASKLGKVESVASKRKWIKSGRQLFAALPLGRLFTIALSCRSYIFPCDRNSERERYDAPDLMMPFVICP